MKDAREAGLRKYFVERIGDPVAGRKLLQGRMKFQAVNPARRHPTARLGDRLRATVRVEAAESKRNVGVALGEIRHPVVRNNRSAGQGFIHRENNAGHPAGPVILRQGSVLTLGAASSKILLGRLLDGRIVALVLDVDIGHQMR